MHKVSYEQIGTFAAAILPHVKDTAAQSAILEAARGAFDLQFPEEPQTCRCGHPEWKRMRHNVGRPCIKL